MVYIRRTHLLALIENYLAAKQRVHGAEGISSDLGLRLLQFREAAPAQLLVHHSGVKLVASFL